LLAQAQNEIAKARHGSTDVIQGYEQARGLMERGAEAYKIGNPDTRRLLTRAFLARVEVDTEDETATLASPWLEIQSAVLYVRDSKDSQEQPSATELASTQPRRPSHTNPDLLFEDRGSKMNPLVDLLGCYSKRTMWTSRLPKPRDIAVSDQSSARRDRRPPAKQLTAVEVDALVDGYRSGATVYELAARFSIHRNTVSQHLNREGVARRRQGLGDDQVDHAVRLYRAGQSLARIGARLDVDAGTVHSALRARGVRMRDTHGRDR
jgi:hypothetical protein